LKSKINVVEDYHVKLDNLKTALNDVAERALGPVKEQILPLQNQEAGQIKDRLRKFDIKVREYRQDFQSNCPYHVTDSSHETINKSYDVIIDYYNKTLELEKEATELNNLETLFDMQQT
jgi:hypothetical protein